MDRFCYENFYWLEPLAGLLPITAILLNCCRDVAEANKEHAELEAAINESRRLQMESLRPEQVRKRIQAMKKRMGQK